MTRVLCLVVALSVSGLAGADDIDIYLRALERSSPELVIYVDWAAVAEAPWARDMPAQLVASLRALAAPGQWPWGPPTVALTLLLPRIAPCPVQGCADPEWRIFRIPDLRQEPELLALEHAMTRLVDAASTGAPGVHSEAEVIQAVQRLLGDSRVQGRCSAPQILQLRFDSPAQVPGVEALTSRLSASWTRAVSVAAGLDFVSVSPPAPVSFLDEAYLPVFKPSPTMPWQGALERVNLARPAERQRMDVESRLPPGALMHSTPAIADYGSREGFGPAGRDLRLLVGGNAGEMHMLRLTAPASGDHARGDVAWSWMPPAMLDHRAQFEGASAVSSFPYGVDAPPVIFRRDRDQDGAINAAEGDKLWLFFGLRRGGRELYALDITDPDRPQLMWRIGPDIAGFEQLGLTFSTPQTLMLDLGEANPRAALIFGGGYSETNDAGRSVYIVDMASGALLWGADSAGVSGMYSSFPAPAAVLDSDGDGAHDRAYIADTGGQLWRIDLPRAGADRQGEPAELLATTTVRRLARLAGPAEAGRRFFHQVDVVRTRDGFGDYDGVVLVSGDRSRPLATGVADYAYLIKDRNGLTDLDHDQLTDVTDICRRPDTDTCRAADLEHGWALALQGPGEKGFAPPLVHSGKVLFATYQPDMDSADPCDPALGTGHLYAVDLLHGAPVLRELYPARTWDTVEDLPPVTQRFFVLGQGLPAPVTPYRDKLILPAPGPDGSLVLEPAGRLRWRVHWRESQVDPP